MKNVNIYTPALILIDFQKAFDNISSWGEERNNPEAENNAASILTLWREKKMPIFHIQHYSNNPSSLFYETNKGHEIKDILKPNEGERVIKKNVNSAFIGTNLKGLLDESKITKLIITGLTTDHCVSTTTRMAGNFGYETYLVADATATFNKKGINGENYPAELIHDTALASLNNEFAKIVSIDFIQQFYK